MSTSSDLSSPIASLVRAIHASDLRLVLAITGGGSQAIADLLTVPGGSRTLIEAIVPYSPESLTAWLGSPPEHYCAPRTARAMAMTAFQRAHKLRERSGSPTAQVEHLLGVGCTASLASDRPKRGAHRVHMALQSLEHTTTSSLELQKDARTRAEEERLIASLVLNSLAAEAGVAERLPLGLLVRETITTIRDTATQPWQALVVGNCTNLVRHEPATDEAPIETPRPGLVLFSGAFNPLHDGHRRMAAVAAKLLGRAVEFEISIENVDKPRLDYTEMASRLAQFPDAPLWFTRAATFVEKSKLFAQATFVVGVDTVQRINDSKYYGNNQNSRDCAISEIAKRGCRFLVFGRADDQHGFRTLSDLQLTRPLAEICQEVPEQHFRADISSTELRRDSTP